MDAHIDAIQELHEELDRLRATCREQGQDEGTFKIIPKDEIIASIELNSQVDNSENTLISIFHSHPAAVYRIFIYLNKTKFFYLYIATHKSTAIYRTFCFLR